MGVIVDELRRLLERQINESQIVLWFDPEQHYETASKELPCVLNRLVMRPGVQWEQARSPVVWLAV
jgi:hypothetical protein